MVVAAVAGALIGFLGMRYGAHLLVAVPGPKWLNALPLVALPFIWFVAVGFHELGHLMGGWLMGGRFILWAAGPLMVRRTPAGVRAGWNRSVNVSGGMAICLPLEPARMTPRRVAVMILGGPVFSLLLAGLMFPVGPWLASGSHGITVAEAILQNLTVLTAGLSLLLFVATAVPSFGGGFKSDGKRAYELLRGGRASEQEAAMLVLTSTGLSGVRPRDFDPVLVRQVGSLRDGSLFDLYGHFTLYTCAADQADWPAAQAHLDYVLSGGDKLLPYVRDAVRCEYAWLLATRTADPAAARAWLESAGRLEFEPATRLRAEAAVLLAEGKPAEAAAKAREALHALEHRSLSPVKSVFAAEAIDTILRRATAPQM
jgi:hypothetical protein